MPPDGALRPGREPTGRPEAGFSPHCDEAMYLFRPMKSRTFGRTPPNSLELWGRFWLTASSNLPTMTAPSASPASTVERVTSPVPSADDHDVATGLAVKAVTSTLGAMAATAVGIGLIGAGAASMAQVENGGDSGDIVIPGLTVLMVGQLAAVVATAFAIISLVSLLRGRVTQPNHAVRGLSRALGLCAKILLAGCILAIGFWAFYRPSAILPAVFGAVVAVQVAVIIGLVRSKLLTSRSAVSQRVSDAV